MNIVCLAGGVGGAKLADGLARILPTSSLTIIGNTGDDFEHWGLTICPDLDTVMYTLADAASKERGWGLEGETWRTLEQVRELDGADWFNLGDLDLATHLTRTHALRQEGRTLADVTRQLCNGYGVKTRLLPMSNRPAPTMIETADGTSPFQDWFVRQRWQPVVKRVVLPENVHSSADVILALQKADVVIIAPSNPFLSIDPILNTYPIRAVIEDLVPVVVAVTPIIGNDAVKGPLAKMMRDWGMPVAAETVARYYGNLLTGFVSDKRCDPFAIDSVSIIAHNTLMRSVEDRIRTAHAVINFVEQQLGELT